MPGATAGAEAGDSGRQQYETKGEAVSCSPAYPLQQNSQPFSRTTMSSWTYKSLLPPRPHSHAREQSTLGIHNVRPVTQASLGLGTVCGAAQPAHRSLYLVQVSTSYHGGSWQLKTTFRTAGQSTRKMLVHLGLCDSVFLNLELTNSARLTWIKGSFCLHLPSSGITDLYHGIWFSPGYWGTKLSPHACKVNTID